MLKLFALVGIVAACGCAAVVVSKVLLSHSHTESVDSATVQVAKSADEVYAAEVRVIEGRSDLKIVKRDLSDHMVEAVRGKDRIRVDASPLGSGSTGLVVTASADGKWKGKGDLALDLEKQICDELGVEYTTVNMASK
ncbi:MAG: hypothetical protein GXP25_22000 [Planctomycetes bacterium]|nr:hypothetical protein [Planctomycetota bacterium]